MSFEFWFRHTFETMNRTLTGEAAGKVAYQQPHKHYRDMATLKKMNRTMQRGGRGTEGNREEINNLRRLKSITEVKLGFNGAKLGGK